MDFLEGIIPEDKNNLYILNPTHPIGWPKGKFLISLGFKVNQPDEIIQALLKQAISGLLTNTYTDFGQKLEIDGAFISPTGLVAQVRTIWYIPHNETTPRFVTFKPLRKTR